jgi:tetratricopeptide (TPR) repeat protein
MIAAPTPVEIFCSYAHEDEGWRDKLERHLSVLQRQGLISLWHDRLIVPGTNWAKAIDTHLDTASIVLLLVSADFFSSDYCVGIEMQRALAKQEEGSALMIPILVRQVNWQNAPFAHLQVLPDDANPLAEWHDEEMALSNVTKGIRRAVETLPMLAASAPHTVLPAIWNIPYPRNPFFLGRESELAQIRQRLQAGQTMALSQPQAISGLGGIGKTQVALEYAYQHHHDYTAVLWARAESAEALISSYVSLATLLRLPQREAKEQQVTIQAVKTWLQTHRSWLLILDNADELTLLSDFLPPSLGGHLLLTTRAVATGRLAHRLEIETLLPEQGVLLLLRRATLIALDAMLEQASQEERELATQISQELGGLPLALDQVGAYLEETGMDLRGYIQLYQQQRVALLYERRGGLVADHPASVATTWSLSFERVQEKNLAAAHLLRMAAFLSPDAIPEELFTDSTPFLDPILAPVAADPLRFNRALEVLRAYSLIRRNPTSKTLSLHRLVQVVLQDTLEEEEQRRWAERVVLAANAVFPHVEPKTWPQCERLLTQAMVAAQWIKQYQFMSEEAARLLTETASYHRDRARYPEAEPLYQRALQIREQSLGLEHSDVAYSLNNLAELYRVQGKYAEAKPLYQRALHIWEQSLGLEHPNVAHPLNGLANLYREQGKYAEAEPLYQRALRLREQSLGPEHPLVAAPLNNLAILYREQGKYSEAEPLYQRALQIGEQSLGLEHPDVAPSLNNLAELYSEQGKYAEAELLYQRALQIREQSLGPEHPDVAISLNNLAILYSEQGKYTEAEPLYQRALRIWEQSLGPEHSDVAYSLNNLAELYRLQGKYTEAEPLSLRALRIWEQQLGPEHSNVAYPLNNLAELYRDQGKYAEAEPLYQRALRIWEQSLGPEHSDVAYSLNGLANLYREQSKYAEAEPLYLRALHIREQSLEPEHPETAESLHDLAIFQERQGNYQEALSLYQRAFDIRERVLGPEHPKTRVTYQRLTVLRQSVSKNVDAPSLNSHFLLQQGEENT